MPKFKQGHFDGIENNGWYIGHFGKGPLQTEGVEVKWAHHAIDSIDKPWAACEVATTLSVLISGKFEMNFKNVGKTRIKTVTLKEPGDFVLFGPGIEHVSQALEESVFLTVRWPSIKPRSNSGSGQRGTKRE